MSIENLANSFLWPMEALASPERSSRICLQYGSFVCSSARSETERILINSIGVFHSESSFVCNSPISGNSRSSKSA